MLKLLRQKQMYRVTYRIGKSKVNRTPFMNETGYLSFLNWLKFKEGTIIKTEQETHYGVN